MPAVQFGDPLPPWVEIDLGERAGDVRADRCRLTQKLELGAAVLGRRIGHQQDRVRAGQHGHRGGALYRGEAADARRVHQLQAVGEDVPGNPGLRVFQARVVTRVAGLGDVPNELVDRHIKAFFPLVSVAAAPGAADYRCRRLVREPDHGRH